jgi:hypothetical protein
MCKSRSHSRLFAQGSEIGAADTTVETTVANETKKEIKKAERIRKDETPLL